MTNTTQNLSPAMQVFYEKTLIDNAQPKLVYDAFGDKYPIPKNNGKTIQFRKYSSLAKAQKPLTEGVTPEGKSIEVTSKTAEIEQYGDYVVLSDLLTLSSIDSNLVQVSKLLGSQAGRTLDSITRDVLCAGTNVVYMDNAKGETLSRYELDSTSLLNPEVFHRVSAQLNAMNADTIDGSYVAIVHPYTAYDIMKNPEWVDIHKYASPENIFDGEIGKIGNVRFVVSSEAKVFRSEDLSSTRELSVASADGASITVEETLYKPNSLINRVVSIGDSVARIKSVDHKTLTLDKTIPAKKGDKICPAETGKGGISCFATIVLGAHAYASTEIEGGGLKHIVKQSGYGEDPLNQRASVGWKATKAVMRLVEQYMVRIESTSTFNNVEAN